jgi:hypothetical protein
VRERTAIMGLQVGVSRKDAKNRKVRNDLAIFAVLCVFARSMFFARSISFILNAPRPRSPQTTPLRLVVS